jgi:diphthamide biosynthesis protein 4
LTASRPRPRFDPTINYYQALDVPPGATGEEITRAYRALMRITHPDNFRDADQRSKAEERCKLINAAYTVLSRPETRREYDAQIRTTAMSDALMQRYTGNAPVGGAAARPRPRRPSARTMRATRRANHLAVIQILIVTAAFVGAMVIVIAAAYLVVEVIAALI